MGEVATAFYGRDGAVTKALYDRLFAIQPAGGVAVNLLRASKNSGGGKKGSYTGRGRRAAYESKDWAIGQVCAYLKDNADELGIVWGWGRDEKTIGFEDVLYVDLPAPFGQVSFHTRGRRGGPDYLGQWDGVKNVTAARVVAWAQHLLDGGKHVEGDRTKGTGAARTAGSPVREESGASEGSSQGCFDDL